MKEETSHLHSAALAVYDPTVAVQIKLNDSYNQVMMVVVSAVCEATMNVAVSVEVDVEPWMMMVPIKADIATSHASLANAGHPY